MNNDSTHVFKLLLVGKSGTGKSSLLMRFADEEFSESYISTIGLDFKVRTINLNGKEVKLQIWDTAGQERFKTITSSYYRGADGIFLVFDLSCRSSFTDLPRWIKDISKYNVNLKTNFFLLGNKSDLKHERQVSHEEAFKFANQNNMEYLETSAKDDVNILHSFARFAEILVHDQERQLQTRIVNAIQLETIREERKKRFIGCC